jgi:hypothetical protein
VPLRRLASQRKTGRALIKVLSEPRTQIGCQTPSVRSRITKLLNSECYDSRIGGRPLEGVYGLLIGIGNLKIRRQSFITDASSWNHKKGIRSRLMVKRPVGREVMVVLKAFLDPSLNPLTKLASSSSPADSCLIVFQATFHDGSVTSEERQHISIRY